MNRLILMKHCWILKSMVFPPFSILHTNQNPLPPPRLRRALSQATRQSSRPNSHRGSRIIPTSRRTSRQIDDVEEDPEQAQVTNVHGFDLEEYLQRSNQEAYNSGIISKKIGVSFRNLSVTGTGSGYAVVSTFFDEFLTLFGKSILERGWGYGRKAVSRVRGRGEGGGGGDVKYIIQGFSGVVRPGEMLLVLGRPGSGTSTFLRALTNQRREFTSIEGDIHYSGVPFELAEGRYRGEILFNSEGFFFTPPLCSHLVFFDKAMRLTYDGGDLQKRIYTIPP